MSQPSNSATFRFRPRYRPLAYTAIGVGALLLAAAPAFGLIGASFYFAVGAGISGLGLGAMYLASPAWRLRVVVDDDGLEVGTASATRFRLAWSEVRRVVASPSTRTCFVDGGEPARSLMVPGPGADAPYDIEDKGALYDAVLARVDAERIEEVELLEKANLSADEP